MNSVQTSPALRGRFDGVLQIARYNWPQYAGAAVVVAIASWWLTCNPEAGTFVRAGAWVAVILAAWWALASLVASHWIYDCSPLYRWEWIPGALPETPKRWLNLHAGLDESSDALARLFPSSHGLVGDFYVATEMSEPSIQRAREEQRNVAPVTRVDPLCWPFAEQSFDAVFLLFAAHELRKAASREAFMAELRRVLVSGGTVLLVEHDRNGANFAAFGPGFLHFLPAAEWRRLSELAHLQLVSERHMTPFVSIRLLRKTP